MPTIRQIAKAAGVSPMTVSFVLNNKPGQVSEPTRARVLSVVREMGYEPGASRGRTVRRNVTLGLVAGVPGDSLFDGGYCSTIVNGILYDADQKRIGVTIFANSLLHDEPRQGIRVYCDGRCDGLIVIAPGIGNPLVAALRERGIPCVLIGDNADYDDVPSVDLDNTAAGIKAVEKLLEHGHKRIAFVGGPDFVRSATVRQMAYRQALEQHGLEYRADWELTDLVFRENATDRIHAMLDRPASDRPTAVFCWNDGIAADLILVMKELGLRMPGDISVVAIDGSPVAAAQNPPLVSLQQPYRAIGSRAIEIVMNHIRGVDKTPYRECFEAEWTTGGSVGPPPGTANPA